MQNEPLLVRGLLTEILRDIASGALRSLPSRAFAAADAISAFRYMAQARHIGKIVVTQPSAIRIKPDRTYLITGGLGALGLRVAAWLVEQGARHLVLIGRNAPGAAAREALKELESAGAGITVAAADVAKRAELESVLNALDKSIPLAGVVHAAGVLNDGILIHQNASRFAQVMAPKVAGTWNLHELTQDQPLEFFILFSSIVAIAGSPGQGNYAAANAFLDAFAHYRRSLGLPALSINWGAWADTGMASQSSSRDRQRWIDQGIVPIPPDRGLECMTQLLADGTVQASVLPMRWERFLSQFSEGVEPPLYAEVERGPAAKPAVSSMTRLLDQLKVAAPNQRRSLLADYVRNQAVKTMGLDALQPIDSQQPLSELGLDSLMAVEIRNALGMIVGRTLPVSLLYDYPTIDALTNFLAEQMPGFGVESESKTPPQPESQLESQSEQLAQISEAEAEALLLKELEALNF
jgi:myxalamid-type polyketide synthase MxaB